MKRTLVMAVVALALLVSGKAWSDPVVGYISDRDQFPQLFEQPSCGDEYSSFLNAAQPLIACKHLAEAQAEQAAQQQLAKQLATIKNCGKCKHQMAMAEEAAAAYGEQINIYSKQCPPEAQRLKLAASLQKEAKQVCKACKNQWPGKLGTDEGNPCK